jgi:hypothetical protein
MIKKLRPGQIIELLSTIEINYHPRSHLYVRDYDEDIGLAIVSYLTHMDEEPFINGSSHRCTIELLQEHHAQRFTTDRHDEVQIYKLMEEKEKLIALRHRASDLLKKATYTDELGDQRSSAIIRTRGVFDKIKREQSVIEIKISRIINSVTDFNQNHLPF